MSLGNDAECIRLSMLFNGHARYADAMMIKVIYIPDEESDLNWNAAGDEDRGPSREEQSGSTRGTDDRES